MGRRRVARMPPRPSGSSDAVRILVALVLAVLALVTVVPALASAAAAAPPTVRRGPADRPRIALTFDDNYAPARATAVLRTLKAHGVPATVFVNGVTVAAFPGINELLADPLFEVGDHTQSHRKLTGLSWNALLAEIGGGTSAFNRATGKRTVPLFRPPYGAVNGTVVEAAGAKGFHYVVLWDVDTNDWRGRTATAIRDHVLRNAHNGAIVLMHLSAPNTAAALPGIISGLWQRGYELVDLSTLLKGGRRFLDVTQGTAADAAVLRLVELGYMNGYDADYFGPRDPMTRAQLAKVAVLVAALHTAPVEQAADPTFLDVPPVRDASGTPLAYPFDFVEEAAAAGILLGRPSDAGQFFDPDRPITRVQLAQIAARMARELKGFPADFGANGPSFGDVPDYAAADVGFAAQLGLMGGFPDGRFDPWAPARRAHVALVMSRYLDLPGYQQ